MAKQPTSTPQTKPAKIGSSTAGARKVAAPRTGPGDGFARRVGTPSLMTFFQESRSELRKVTWPTRQETMNLTGAVIAMTVSIAVFLGLVDAVLAELVKRLVGA